jgi:hypothetical protein
MEQTKNGVNERKLGAGKEHFMNKIVANNIKSHKFLKI